MTGQEFNITSFTMTLIIATVVGIAGLLASLKAISILVPKWDFKDSFKKDNITNSGLIIAVYVYVVGRIIASAIF